MADSNPPLKDELAPASLPGLLQDFRTRREAWRAQSHDLVRLRDDVLAAADRESGEILASARAEVRRVVLKARRELLVLNAQVQATIDMGEPRRLESGAEGDQPQAPPFTPQGVWQVLHEARPDLEALSSETGAFRSELMRLQMTPATDGADMSTDEPRPQEIFLPEISRTSSPDTPPALSRFEQTAEDRRPPRGWRRPVTVFVAAAALIGVSTVAATQWWVRRSAERTPPAAAQPPPAAPAPQPTNPAPVTGASGPSREATASPLMIQVEARRQAWIRVTADGREGIGRLFRPGETTQVSAEREALIRAGDAGAVFVSVNRGPATALGANGQVLTRRFAVPSAAGPAAAPPTAPPSPAAPASPASATAPAPQPATPPLAPAPGEPAPPVPSPDDHAAVRDQLAVSAERWFDAYYLGDRERMAAFASTPITVKDERAPADRLPPGLSGVKRTIEDARVQVAGFSAVLTAKITERGQDQASGRATESVCFISQIWTQRAGGWQLNEVRIVSAGALNRAFRR